MDGARRCLDTAPPSLRRSARPTLQRAGWPTRGLLDGLPSKAGTSRRGRGLLSTVGWRPRLEGAPQTALGSSAPVFESRASGPYPSGNVRGRSGRYRRENRQDARHRPTHNVRSVIRSTPAKELNTAAHIAHSIIPSAARVFRRRWWPGLSDDWCNWSGGACCLIGS